MCGGGCHSRSISNTSNADRFSAAVAAYGMLLRKSSHVGDMTFEQGSALTRGVVGEDRFGHRREFARLVSPAARLRRQD